MKIRSEVNLRVPHICICLKDGSEQVPVMFRVCLIPECLYSDQQN